MREHFLKSLLSSVVERWAVVQFPNKSPIGHLFESGRGETAPITQLVECAAVNRVLVTAKSQVRALLGAYYFYKLKILIYKNGKLCFNFRRGGLYYRY